MAYSSEVGHGERRAHGFSKAKESSATWRSLRGRRREKHAFLKALNPRCCCYRSCVSAEHQGERRGDSSPQIGNIEVQSSLAQVVLGDMYKSVAAKRLVRGSVRSLPYPTYWSLLRRMSSSAKVERRGGALSQLSEVGRPTPRRKEGFSHGCSILALTVLARLAIDFASPRINLAKADRQSQLPLLLIGLCTVWILVRPQSK